MRRLDLSARELAELGQAAVDVGGTLRIVVRGASMLPAIQDGDELTVAALDALPRPGDVVLYRRGNGQVVAHRVLAQQSNGRFIVDADAGQGHAERVPITSMIGRITRVRRGGREVEPHRRTGLGLPGWLRPAALRSGWRGAWTWLKQARHGRTGATARRRER